MAGEPIYPPGVPIRSPLMKRQLANAHTYIYSIREVIYRTVNDNLEVGTDTRT